MKKNEHTTVSEKQTLKTGKNKSLTRREKANSTEIPFDYFRVMRIALQIISYAMAGGIALIVLYSLQGSCWSTRWTTMSVAALIASAAAILGIFFGFLFGIPRTFQGEDNQSTQNQDDATSQQRIHVSYRANTNLEQISDWLTKILVGVGLTQLTSLPTKFASLNKYISATIPDALGLEVMVGATLTYFVICGFLFGYLWTRLYFAGALRAADMQALLQRVARADEKAEKLEAQAMRDAKALSFVRQQLDSQSDTVDHDKLKISLKEASVPVKSTIFWQAYELRRRTWKDDATKEHMERTIPIFEALIEDDERSVYHMNHGQLGFALKDKRQPDFLRAEEELTRAIQIRGDWRVHGWVLYEFARALARIERSREVSAEVKKELYSGIRSDLIVAVQSPNIQKLFKNERVIVDWLKENDLTIDELIGSVSDS